MKYLRQAALVGSALLSLVAGSGCGKVQGAGDSTGEDPLPPVWRFDEGRGVRLAESAVDLLGIELAHASYSDAGGEEMVFAEGTVFSVSPDGTARASVLLSAAKAAGIEQEAGIEAQGREGASAAGRVEQIDRQAARATGQVELIVSVRDNDGALRKGDLLACRITQTAVEPGKALVVPASALLTTARGDFVYVVNGDHFFRSPVQAGKRTERSVEIIDGLFDGDVVVANGVASLWLVELQAINGGESCADGH